MATPQQQQQAAKKNPNVGTPTANPSPQGEPTEAPKVKKGVPEPVVHEGLVKIITNYDEHVEQAETYYVEMIEFIQGKQLSRADVVATLMRARGIGYETAQTQYSKMKGILNNKEILAELKAGKITLRVARERTTKKQENPKSSKPEAKEAKYSNALKGLAAAAKECGFDFDSVMLSVKAELHSVGIK